MHKEGKVVPLAAAIDRGVHSPLPCLPVLLLQVRDKAALQLRQGLQALFDNADDTLFEMADKAQGRLDQSLYFEAMRDLRLKRKSIERGFLDTFYGAFACISQTDPLGHPAELPRVRLQSERAMAIDGMVARVLSRDGMALAQLGQRLQAMLEQPLHAQQNPLGPAALCGYFLDAGRNLGVGLRVKLILLKLFERYVLRDVDVLYGDANQLLAAAGVLPELKPAPRRRIADKRPGSRAVAANLAAGDSLSVDVAAQAFFASLQGLLAPARGRVAPRLQSTVGAEPIGTADLLRLLTHLQHYVPGTVEDDDFDLGQQLEQLLLRVSVRSGTRRRIASADEDMINLVGLLFGYVQADDNLPASLRSLVVRLHIPLLKVALLDKSLFSRASHPARRLLNEIGAAAMGWESGSEGQRDSLHLRVERIVQRLLNDFTDDSALFHELLEEFLAFSTGERRRNDLLEQRTRDAEEGRARAMQARQQVQLEINQRLRGRVLPQVVVQMLAQAWSQVMLLAWLKQGEASKPWKSALATMDALLASIAPQQAPQTLLQQVPGLLKGLREGLATVAVDSAATREFFQQLEQLHVRACSGSGLPSTDDVLVADEIVLAIADESACTPLHQPDDQAAELRAAQALRLGSWVEVFDGDEPLRCKLVARIGSSDRLVFANRTGMKVREWNTVALAQALRRGEVRVLDDGLLFERALAAVLDGLRQQRVH